MTRITHSCPNCYRDYCGGETCCNECGHKTVPVKPDAETGAKIIDLFEALKQSLAPRRAPERCRHGVPELCEDCFDERAAEREGA